MRDGERKTLAKLEYSVDVSGEIYIDIAIEDYSEKTIDKFALLIASVQTTNFQLQTLAVAQEAFTRDGKNNELERLISEILRTQKFQSSYNEESEDDRDKPLISPTDLI